MRKTRTLLLSGNGKSDQKHPFYNELIQEHLTGIAEVTVTEDLSVLHSAELKDFDLILNNSFYREPTKNQFAAFFDFIESGNGYFGLHTASVSFLNSGKYRDMMGCLFSHHDPVKNFEVELNASVKEHVITNGMDNFEITDELYVVAGDAESLQVVARADGHPVMWCRPWGNGRILYLALGHDKRAINNPGYVRLLRNGVLWASRNY